MVSLLHWYIRNFPLRKGKVPLLRLADKAGWLKGEVRIGTLGTRSKAELHLDDWVQQLVYFFGVYEFEKAETKAWETLAAKSRVILDIGANFGYYSILSVDVNPGCMVHAFEPAPETFNRLKKNIELNRYGSSVKLNNLALSDKPGVLPLYLASSDNSGMTSLSRPDSFSGEVVNVTIAVVDEYLKTNAVSNVDLVKIDVEGNEFNVLKGMSETLSTSRPVVFIELLNEHLTRFGSSVDQVLEFMERLGYQCHEYDRSGTLHVITSGKDIGLAIFMHRDRKALAVG